MLRRSSRLLLEFVAGTFAIVALVIGVTLWRLSEGPLSVDFLTPYLEQALADVEKGLEVEVEETVLVWADWTRNPDVRARNIRVRNSDGLTLVALPEVAVGLSLHALVNGVVAPTSIAIFDAQVTLIREQDGSFQFGKPEHSEDENESALQTSEADFSILFPELLAELLSEPNPARPLSFLRTVRFRDGQLTIIDRRMRGFWHVPEADVELRRARNGLTGEADLKLLLGERTTDIGLKLSYLETTGLIDLGLQLSGLQLSAVASLDENLLALDGLDVPIYGSITAGLGKDGLFTDLEFDLFGAPGVASLPGFLAEPLPVRSLIMRGGLDGANRALELETAKIRFGDRRAGDIATGPELRFAGRAELEDGDVELMLEGQASNVPADQLGLYWPLILAPNARNWVTENIRGGIADEAGIEMLLKIPSGDFNLTTVENLSGFYRFRNLDVFYLRPMPPVGKVSGTARFDKSKMVFEVRDGALGEIEAPEGKIEITFDTDPEEIDIDLAFGGPLPDSLRLVDHESLGLLSALGLDPATTRGTAAGRLGFHFPLVSDLGFKSVGVRVTAELAGAGVDDVVLGQDLENGNFKLDLDNSGMTVVGPAEMGGIPVDLNWRESFLASDQSGSRFNVRIAEIDQPGLSRFGMNFAPYLNGPVSASLDITLGRGHRGMLDAAVDLTQAELNLPFISWHKPPGEPGDMDLTLELDDGRPKSFKAIQVRAGTLSGRGRGEFDPTDGQWSKLEFNDLTFAGSRLFGVAIEREGEAYRVAVAGGVLDAAPIMARRRGAAVTGEGTGDATTFELSAPRLSAVRFGDERYLEDVSLRLRRGPEGWEEISVQSRIPRPLWSPAEQAETPARLGFRRQDDDYPPIGRPDPEPEAAPPAVKTFSLNYRPRKTRGYRLKAETNDLGALLRALDLRDTFRGGHLTVEARSEGPIPLHTLSGHIDVQNYVLIGAPPLARVLTVASLTGLVDTLGGNGIRFENLSGDFDLTDGVFRTELVNSYGPALGVTARGSLDFNASQMELEGTLVPAYSLKRVLGLIPIFGQLIIGGEGEGLFAFTYEMNGSFNDPDVAVSGLSALAPAFLRGLFGSIDGKEATVYPEPPER